GSSNQSIRSHYRRRGYQDLILRLRWLGRSDFKAFFELLLFCTGRTLNFTKLHEHLSFQLSLTGFPISLGSLVIEGPIIVEGECGLQMRDSLFHLPVSQISAGKVSLGLQYRRIPPHCSLQVRHSVLCLL